MVTPTRSSASRRKRNSTTQALDLLNSVMNRNASVAEDRQTQSARPARQSRNIPRAPRRDLFEIPNSPEQPRNRSSPLAVAAPLTPHRSTRISRPQAEIQNDSFRTPARTQRVPVDYNNEDNAGEEESNQPPHEETDNTPVNEDEGPNSLEYEGNELIGNFDLFSEANSSRHSRSVSPSVFLTQELEQSGWFESTQSPNKTETLKRAPESIASNKPVTRNSSKTQRPTSEAVLPGPSVVIHTRPNNVLETSLPKEQSTRGHPTSSPAKDDDGDVEMDDGEQIMSSEHADSDGESPDEASSDSSLFVRQDSPNQASLSATRSGKLRKPPNTRALRTRSSGTTSDVHTESTPEKSPVAQDGPSPARRPVGHQLNRTRTSSLRLSVSGAKPAGPNGPLVSRRIRNRNSRIVTNYNNNETVENPAPESIYPRCKEAMKLGQQEHNWKALVDERRKMKQKAKSVTRCGFLKYTIEFVDDLQCWYEDLYQNSERPQRLSPRDSHKHKRHLDRILCEGDSALDEVYNLVMEHEEKQGRKLFQDFEARVIPAIIKLVLTIFDAYHSSPRSLSSIYDHLHSALNKLAHLCNRMTSLAKERYVESSPCTQKLREPLQKLIEASETRSLESTQLDASDSSESDGVDDNGPIVTIQKPWTDAEGLALLDGLMRHSGMYYLIFSPANCTDCLLGPKRYISITKDFGDRLEGRTIGQLRDKAEEVHDNYVPQIHDELRTREGREKWHWLLSVRE